MSDLEQSINSFSEHCELDSGSNHYTSRLERLIEIYNLYPSEDITDTIQDIIGLMLELGVVADPVGVDLNIDFLDIALQQIRDVGDDEIRETVLEQLPQIIEGIEIAIYFDRDAQLRLMLTHDENDAVVDDISMNYLTKVNQSNSNIKNMYEESYKVPFTIDPKIDSLVTNIMLGGFVTPDVYLQQ